MEFLKAARAAALLFGAVFAGVGVFVMSTRGLENVMDVMSIALGLGYVAAGALIIIAANSFHP